MADLRWFSGGPSGGRRAEGTDGERPRLKPSGRADRESAAEVLEEGSDRDGVAPTGEASRGAVTREMGERLGRGVGEDADQAVKGERKADGARVRDADIARLDSPLADAVVRILGAVSRDGRGASGMMAARKVSGLGRPADERAGQDEDSQERAQEHSHRKWPVLRH